MAFLLKWSEVNLLSRVQLFATLWTVAGLAPLSMGFSRQEYWSGLPFPSPGDLPNPGIEPWSPAWQAYLDKIKLKINEISWSQDGFLLLIIYVAEILLTEESDHLI